MPAVAVVLDALVVLVFAAIGRRSHDEGGAVMGVLTTAGPFLAGALVGWLLVLAWRRTLAAGRTLSAGVVIWLCTVVGGMVIRPLVGRGVAVSFVVVTLVFNGLFLLGWRAAVTLLERRRV